MTVRLAIVVSHPIQHFAPWHRELAKCQGIDLRVYFCCDWGVENYMDPEFHAEFRWDVPLLDGYDHEFLPIRQPPRQFSYRELDNPAVIDSLDKFQPDVVKVFGYASRTNWRVAKWARSRRKPLLLYSDSSSRASVPVWKRLIKSAVVGRFYRGVDGALFVGDNNREYHLGYGIPRERLFAGCLPIDRARLLRAVPNRPQIRRTIREQHGIPENAFVVMLCGKFSSRKRPLDLVAAVHALSNKGVRVWGLLVGEGAEREKMETYCRVNQVDNITLTGFINQSTVPAYYAAADVLAVTSDMDPHPLVVSEAGTFGLPAIVSDRVGCIGPNDTARPGVNADVYPCGDVARLTDTIEALYLDQDRYRRMSEAATEISISQDVTVAAEQLFHAAQKLRDLGPR